MDWSLKLMGAVIRLVGTIWPGRWLHFGGAGWTCEATQLGSTGPLLIVKDPHGEELFRVWSDVAVGSVKVIAPKGVEDRTTVWEREEAQ
jgi:hypothetical protein